MDFGAAVARIRAELAARPPFLRDVFERWIEIVELQPKRLVELHGLQLLATYAERRRVEPRLPARRQAIALVVGALLIDADLCSLRSGFRRGDGEWSGRGHEWIAELTGLTCRRIRRAIFDLKLAGYLSSTQPIEPYLPEGKTSRADLKYCAHHAIYRFELRFFERLSYDKRLKRERGAAIERRKNRGRLYAASLVRARYALRKLRKLNSPTPARSRSSAIHRPPNPSR